MHAVLGHATQNNKAQDHDDLGLETSDTKVCPGSKMRYRHNSSTPAQSCARGWLQQSLRTQKDDMCTSIAHNENLTACFFRVARLMQTESNEVYFNCRGAAEARRLIWSAKLQIFSELTKPENENLYPDMRF